MFLLHFSAFIHCIVFTKTVGGEFGTPGFNILVKNGVEFNVRQGEIHFYIDATGNRINL